MDDKADTKAEELEQDKIESAVPTPVADNAVVEKGSLESTEQSEKTPEPIVEPVVASAPAVVAAPPAAAQSKPESAGKRELSLLDMAGGVLLLALISLLAANCYVAYLGRSYNERVLKEAIALAGKAANEGLDTPHVQLAAFGCFAHCASPGFFVEHPEFVLFKDEPKPDENMRIITITTSTKVRLPAPFLILDQSVLDQDDQYFHQVTFRKTYQYQLSNPKNIHGVLIRRQDGKVIRVPKPGEKAVPAAKPADKGEKKEEKK